MNSITELQLWEEPKCEGSLQYRVSFMPSNILQGCSSSCLAHKTLN